MGKSEWSEKGTYSVILAGLLHQFLGSNETYTFDRVQVVTPGENAGDQEHFLGEFCEIWLLYFPQISQIYFDP